MIFKRLAKMFGRAPEPPADPIWLVSCEGQVLARLVDGQFYDMFWLSWRLEPLVTEPELLAKLYSSRLWCGGQLTFTRQQDGHIAPHPFAAAFSIEEMPTCPERVTMRALY